MFVNEFANNLKTCPLSFVNIRFLFRDKRDFVAGGAAAGVAGKAM